MRRWSGAEFFRAPRWITPVFDPAQPTRLIRLRRIDLITRWFRGSKTIASVLVFLRWAQFRHSIYNKHEWGIVPGHNATQWTWSMDCFGGDVPIEIRQRDTRTARIEPPLDTMRIVFSANARYIWRWRRHYNVKKIVRLLGKQRNGLVLNCSRYCSSWQQLISSPIQTIQKRLCTETQFKFQFQTVSKRPTHF
jgi:hypothetical protein